ncbi:MAG: hypothetical protein AAGA91_16785 [Pseudomonadota bacterium]
MSGTVASLTDDAERGRVVGLFVLLLAGVAPIGAVLLGGLADLLSLPAVLAASAVLMLTLVVLSEVLPATRGIVLGRAPSG